MVIPPIFLKEMGRLRERGNTPTMGTPRENTLRLGVRGLKKIRGKRICERKRPETCVSKHQRGGRKKKEWEKRKKKKGEEHTST